MSKAYTPAQQQAIETTGRHLCVDAGAGSGKTMVLIERMLRLLETGQATLDEIVAITFTERAAGEMKERLRREAHRRAPRDDAARQSFWRDIERRADTARISTIHSFCMAILKERALALGHDPDFAILNDAEGYILRHESAESTIHNALERQDDAAVRLAVEFGAKRLTEELARLLKDRGKLERALAAADYTHPSALLAHWREAATRACMDRIAAMHSDLQHAVRELRALDGCCDNKNDKRELLRVALLAEAETILAATTPTEAAEAYARLTALKASGGSLKAWASEDAFKTIKDHRDSLKKSLEFLKDQACDPALEERAAELTCAMASLYREAITAYREEKRARAVLEFDDLVLDTLAIVRDRTDIRRSIAADIKFLLIDEFQDTDNLQLELAQLLASEKPGPELFFVGDAKQSIYYFRGAEVQVFDKARAIAGDTIRLDTNFRTVPDVLEFVNDFFECSGLLHLVEPVYRRMIPHRNAAGDACIELILPRETEEKITVRDARRHEAALLASRIKAMVEGAEPLCIEDPATHDQRHARYGDIAVLFRATSDLYVYEQALQAAGVPYYVVAGSGFYQRQEILDLLNLLHVVIDPHDTYALFGFLRSPIAGISDETLLTVEWTHGFAHAFAHEPYNGPQADAFHRAQALIADLRAHRDLPLDVFLRRVLEVTAYEAILLGQYLGEQKAANVRKMVDLAHQFGHARAPSLRAFVRYADEMANVELPEGEASMLPDGNAVTLMTIHKSKGLEFPIVFVPDLGRDQAKSRSALTAIHPEFGLSLRPYNDTGTLEKMPFHAAIQHDHHIKEEAEHARILYVALTRARERLVLSTGTRKSRDDDKAKSNSKSKSWLNAILAVLNPGDDDLIADPRGRWQCRILRDLPLAEAPQSAEKQTGTIDTEALARRVAPIECVLLTRRIFGVSEVLHAMVPHAPQDLGLASRPSRDAMRRGELVHRLFELWDGTAPLESIVSTVLAEFGVPVRDHPRTTEDLAAIAQRVANHPLQYAIQATPRASRERPFILRIDDALIRGEIDALLPDKRVLDYKTGTRRPELEERYFWQLRLYAAAVHALDGSVADDAILLYVDTGEAVPVDVSQHQRNEALARAAAAIAHLRRGTPPHATADPDYVEA